jgi:hypothetical protein
MRLIGIMPVRNEAWVLGLSARAALMWVDELVIGLHACAAASHDIAFEVMHEHPGRVTLYYLGDGEWAEMEHRQTLLTLARRCAATHIAIIDADEVLTGNLLSPTYPGEKSKIWMCAANAVEGQILQIPLYNLRNGIQSYHQNGLWGNRIVSLAFKDEPVLGWSGDTFHQREPKGKRLQSFQPVTQGEGGVMHLWGASERRLIAKHALYKITERLRWPDKDVRQIDFEYSQCVKGGLREDPKKWTYAQAPLEWWLPYTHLMQYLDVDAEPWQEAECRRLVAEHGREKFAGFDLFGVA